jgi:plastocyanin
MAASLVLGACSLTATAQMGAAPNDGVARKNGAAPGTMVSPAKALDDLLSLFEREAMGVAMAMPADKYGFAPSAAMFAPGQTVKYEGVRTFAQEVTHVAEANYYFYSAVSGLKPDVDTTKIESLTSKEDAVAALAGSIAFAHKAIATITAENAFETIKGADGMHTRATLAAFGVAHGYDHYGQMVEYLRMNGIVPPGSK